MSRAISGEHNMTCERTGFVYKSSEMRREWTGIWVHKSVWEAKHPQLELRPRREEIAVQNARSEGPDYEPTPPTADEL